MDYPTHFCHATSSYRIILYGTVLILFSTLLSTGVLAADIWQPIEVRSWVQVDIPPGWSSSSEKNETTSPDNEIITGFAPDKKTRLIYILDRNQENMTRDEIQKFQSGYMSRLGFRICMTKDPIIEENGSNLSFRQTYVRGVDDAAVIGSMVNSGWGQAHYVLVMEGSQAVADYYESIPALIEEHIRPVSVNETPDNPF